MRVLTNYVLPLSAVLFGLLLIPQAARAAVKDCPVEPKQNVPIADGGIFTGTNCNLYTVGDVDSFVFSANNGDIYLFAAALNSGGQNICLVVIDPNGKQIFAGCTNSYPFGPAVETTLALAVTGRYTMVVTETSASNGTENYAVSLERIHPVPPNAQKVKLGKTYSSEITPLTDTAAFIFNSSAAATYRVTATLPSGNSQNLCANAYNPDGSGAGSGCSNTYPYGSVVQFNFAPTQDGTSMVLLSEKGFDGTVSYTLDISCYLGHCPPNPPPPCTLTDDLSYDTGSSTLTMDFTVGTNSTATWNAWLTYQNTMVPLFSAAQQITVPPVPITKTYTPLSPEGTVGVLSTLTSTTTGITCSSWELYDTGTAP